MLPGWRDVLVNLGKKAYTQLIWLVGSLRLNWDLGKVHVPAAYSYEHPYAHGL